MTLSVDEHRPLLLQYRADPFTERGKVGELVDAAIARGAREAGEADATGAGNRVAAVGLVSAVFADEMDEVARRDLGDGHQAPEIHQQAAVAVEHDDALVGASQRQSQRMRRGLAHRADAEVDQRLRLDRPPFERGLIDGNDDLVRVMASQQLQAFVAAHHGLFRTSG